MSERAFVMTVPAGDGNVFHPQSALRLAGTRTTVAWKGSRVNATITAAAVVDEGRSMRLTIDPDEPVPAIARLAATGEDPCARKIPFPTKRAALDELARIIKRAVDGERRKGHMEKGCYECPDCGAWHLSSKPWDGNLVNERRTQ